MQPTTNQTIIYSPCRRARIYGDERKSYTDVTIAVIMKVRNGEKRLQREGGMEKQRKEGRKKEGGRKLGSG